MDLNYDENISENLFFLWLKENCEDLFKDIILNGWLLCIPRKGTFCLSKLDIGNIQSHVLKSQGKEFYSLKGDIVFIEEKRLKTKDLKDVEVLFEETIYLTKEKTKLKVWCINQPLTDICVVEEVNCERFINNFDSCLAVLRDKNICLEELQSITDNWWSKSYLRNSDISTLKSAIADLYAECLKYNKNESLVELCIETYIQYLIYDHIFPIICNCTSSADVNINLSIGTLAKTQLKDLNLPLEWNEPINKSIIEIAKLCKFKTILEKFWCIKKAFKLIPSSTSDLLILSLVYILASSHITNWMAILTYMQEFRYALVNESDEYSFYMTSLLAAIKYIESGNLHRELHDLIRSGDAEAVRSFLQSTVDTDRLCHPLCSCDKCQALLEEPRDVGGLTALHVASIYGQTRIAEILLESGTSVNVRDRNGWTPLQYAASRGHQAAVLHFLNSGADVNARNADNQTALYLACRYGHESTVKALLYSAADVHINCIADSGDTPLRCATSRGFVGIVRLLVEHGAYAHNKECNRRIFMLLRAIADGDLQLSRYYLESGDLTVNTVTVAGQTALHVAARHGQSDIVRMLLDLGAATGAQGGALNWTPLHEAVHNGHKNIVYELLRRRKDAVNAADSNGNTPLHAACLKRETQIAVVLLSNGADWRRLNNDQLSARDLANSLGLFRVLHWINNT